MSKQVYMDQNWIVCMCVSVCYTFIKHLYLPVLVWKSN